MSYFELSWAQGPAVVFDIGSYNGKDAKRFLDAWPDADVYAFEACTELFRRMANNTALDGIVLEHAAVTDFDGVTWFNAPCDISGEGKCRGAGSVLAPSEILYDKGFRWEPERVDAIRLDTFCRRYSIRHVDLIHMDLQGNEYAALVGLGEMRPGLIFLEMQGGTAHCYEGVRDPEPLLRAMGYDRIAKLPGDQLWRYQESAE